MKLESLIYPRRTSLHSVFQDNWRPLFTIADLIGLDWPARIREAAGILIGTEPDSDDSVLLADIKIGFEAKEVDRLSSEEICEALIAIEGRPWAEHGKSGKPISKNQLAKRLKRFKIIPDTIRIGGKTAKGYYQHQFQEAWDRYLSITPQETPTETSQRNNADEMGTSVAFQSVTEKPVLRFENNEKPPSNGHCYGVTDENAVLEGEDKKGTQKCAQCGKDGAELEAYYGEASAWLHRGACEDAWRAACDLDDLTIPPYLDRRGGAAA